MVWHHHETTVRELLRENRLRDVLEIGVETGVHTRMLLRVLEELDGRLTSIDPQIRLLLRLRTLGNKRIRFVPATSLEALPRLRAAGEQFDCAIVDGDHNWYTVFHELEGLRPMMRRNGVILLHDVAFPYARRDQYYAPERIPAEFRQPHARRGIIEGQSELAPEGGGGKNDDLWHALHEGGPRNGVLTAVEDFVAAHPEEGWKLQVVPSWNGLGILRRP
jgi:predicted O-methyltransferase YrrM